MRGAPWISVPNMLALILLNEFIDYQGHILLT